MRAVRRYIDRDGGTWATIIAWNALSAILPIALVAASILGLILRGDGIQSHIESALGNPQVRTTIGTALGDLRESSGTLGVIGLLGLMWRGSTLFGAIDRGLAQLRGGHPRPLIGQRVMATGMVLVFTALLIPLVLSASLVAFLRALDVVPSAFIGDVFPVLQFVLGWADSTLIFAIIYRLVPSRTAAAHTIWIGALVAGLLMEVLTLGFPAYIGLAHGFTAYGQVFGAALLLMAYFFFLGLIVMLGYCVNLERDGG